MKTTPGKLGMTCVLLSFLAAAGSAAGEPVLDHFDITNYTMDIDLSLETRQIQGCVTIALRSLEAGLLSIDLDLMSTLVVDGVYRDLAPLNFDHVGNALHVELGSPLEEDAGTSVTIDYHGSPTGEFGVGGFTPGIFFMADPEGQTTAFSMGHCLAWYPCRFLPWDKATFDIDLTVPAGLVTVSAGSLTGVVDNMDGTTTHTWSEVHQVVPSSFSIVAGDYTGIEGSYEPPSGTPMPVVIHVFPAHEAEVAGSDAIETAISSIDIFSSLFGPYEHLDEKLSYVEIPFGFGEIGLENATAILLNIGALVTPPQWVLVHETAHMWFGNAVTQGSDPLRERPGDFNYMGSENWLSDGLAQYCVGLYLERTESPARYHEWMAEIREEHMGGELSGVPVVPDGDSYNKPAWILHMMRHMTGDDLFFRFLADYYATYAGRAATTADLEIVAEESMGTGDLKWFFDQWLMRPGEPTFRYSWDAAGTGTGADVTLAIHQSSPDGSIYHVSVDVRTELPGGSLDGVVLVEDAETAFRFSTEEWPLDIVLDPDGWLWATFVSEGGPLPPSEDDMEEGKFDAEEAEEPGQDISEAEGTDGAGGGGCSCTIPGV